MGAATLTITPTSGDLLNGEQIVAGDWVAGFDHAALVAAGRSRADGFDLRIYSRALIKTVPFQATGLNTADCRLEFDYLGSDISNPATSDDYLILIGDLGWQSNPQVAPDGTPNGRVEITIGSFGSLAMPAPDLGARIDFRKGVRAMSNLTARRAPQHENNMPRVFLTWSNLLPQEWHELRAWIASQYGGAARFASSEVPDTQVQAASPYYLLQSWGFEQHSRRSYSARAELLGVVA